MSWSDLSQQQNIPHPLAKLRMNNLQLDSGLVSLKNPSLKSASGNLTGTDIAGRSIVVNGGSAITLTMGTGLSQSIYNTCDVPPTLGMSVDCKILNVTGSAVTVAVTDPNITLFNTGTIGPSGGQVTYSFVLANPIPTAPVFFVY